MDGNEQFFNLYFNLIVTSQFFLPPYNLSMHMLPKSHKSGFYKHASDSEFHIGYGMVDRPNPEDVNSYWSHDMS